MLADSAVASGTCRNLTQVRANLRFQAQGLGVRAIQVEGSVDSRASLGRITSAPRCVRPLPRSGGIKAPLVGNDQLPQLGVKAGMLGLHGGVRAELVERA